MWMRAGEEADMQRIYREAQFFFAKQRIDMLIQRGYKPAEMTVREIYETLIQVAVDTETKCSILDAARIKQVVTNNSLSSD